MKLKSAFLATTALLAAGNALAADVTAYGQVNKLVVSLDNGNETNTAIVDNDSSSTRFGFKAQQQLENGLVVSGLLELQSESNSSSAVGFETDDSNEDASGISERHSRIGIGSDYGTFMIGKTSESTDGISEMDLGGVSDVMYSDISNIGGAASFVKKSDGTALTTSRTIGDLYMNSDGGRTNLVRYDSPSINGVSGSASISSGGDIAVAAKYSGKIDRFKVKAGLGMKKHESNNAAGTADVIDQDISGSVSVLCEKSGLGVTFAMGERSFDGTARKDAEFMYTKLSYLPVGSNFEYAVDYATAESASADNEEIESYGAGAQYNIAKGVSTSVMYRQIEADNLSEEADDIRVLSAGLKVKF